jgi:hypothetical protein
VKHSVVDRPLLVIKSLGHIDRFGERTPDRWAVTRASNGRIVKHFANEVEAQEFASEGNAAQLIGRRRRRL